MRKEKIGLYEINAWAIEHGSRWMGYWRVLECRGDDPCQLIEQCGDGVYAFETSAELDALLEALDFVKSKLREEFDAGLATQRSKG